MFSALYGRPSATFIGQVETLRDRTIAIGGTTSYQVPVRRELVVEIAFNELQVSWRDHGGLALRFARMVRYREDKSAADADTIETVRAIAAAPRTALLAHRRLEHEGSRNHAFPEAGNDCVPPLR